MAKAKYSKNSAGFFETKVWDGTYSADGSKHRIHLRSKKSSADLERKVNEYTHALQSASELLISDYTFGQYAIHWLELKKPAKEQNTQTMYENIINKHLALVAQVPLTDIRHSHFQSVINNAIDKPRTCQQIYITFKQIMQLAVSDSLISADNFCIICSNISLPAYSAKEKRPLTSEEISAITTAAFSEREKAFVYLLYYTGMRRGEALALTRFDFNFLEKTVTVNKDLIFNKNDPVLKEHPKSRNGNRTIPLPVPAAIYLKEYIGTLDGANLFDSANSKFITKSSYVKMWRQIVKKMNAAAGGTDAMPVIQGLTAHIFRHNYCTNLCYQVPSISIKKIAYLLGDTQAMVTKVYSHVIDEKEDVSDAIEKALGI